MAATEQPTTGVARLSLATTTGFIVAAVIIFLILSIFVFFLCLRAKGYWGAYPASSGGNHVSSAAAEPAAAVPRRRGLDASAIEALPSVAFRSGGFKEGAECAVCLCDLTEGEAARLLPACNHAFHLECIDMWFYSHSTCPLCRTPVALDTSNNADSRAEWIQGNAPNSPASVLHSSFHVETSVGDLSSQEGSSGSSSSRPEDALVTETPRRAVDGFHAHNWPLFVSTRFPEEDVRSPLWSLRRLLRPGGRMAGANSSTPSVRDMEQGCLPVPKTPTPP